MFRGPAWYSLIVLLRLWSSLSGPSLPLLLSRPLAPSLLSVTIIDHGRLIVSGTVDELETSGARRLVVRIEGDRTGDWAHNLLGVSVSEVMGGAVRLVLDDSVDSDDVLRAAMRAGHLTEFSFERRRLSEVFREALA